MTKYKDMYYMLFNEVSDAIEKLENGSDTKSVIEKLDELGVLSFLPKSNQISFF